MNKQFANKVTSEITDIYSIISHEYDRKRFFIRPEVQAWAQDLEAGQQLLEVGCASGINASYVQVRDANYFGVDISPGMIDLARQYFPEQSGAKFQVADVCNLPFPDASFDAIWSVATLHHVPGRAKREQAIKEMARVLKVGGKLYLFDWNLYAWKWLKRYHHFGLLFGLHPKGYDPRDVLIPWKEGTDKPLYRYYHAFTLRELRGLIKGAGLKVMRQRFVSNNQTKHWWNGQSIETIVKKG